MPDCVICNKQTSNFILVGQSGTFAPMRIHPNTEFVLKGHL